MSIIPQFLKISKMLNVQAKTIIIHLFLLLFNFFIKENLYPASHLFSVVNIHDDNGSILTSIGFELRYRCNGSGDASSRDASDSGLHELCW